MQTDDHIFKEDDLRTGLAEILQRNSKKWMQLSNGILKNKDDAEEVLSEAVRRMLKRDRTFPSREHMQMYMNRVVNNTAMELYRRKKRERRHYAQIRDTVGSMSAEEQAESFRPDFIMEEEERYAEHENRLNLLRRGLEELPAHQYEAVRLTVLTSRGMTLRDVESASGIPRTTLRYRYQQGIKTLRKFITRELNRKRCNF